MTVYVVALKALCARATFVTARSEEEAAAIALRGNHHAAGPWTPIRPDEMTAGRVIPFTEED